MGAVGSHEPPRPPATDTRWFAALVAVAAAASLYAVTALAEVLLLLFAGIVVGAFFAQCSHLIAHRTGVPRRVALLLLYGCAFLLGAGLTAALVPTLVEQFNRLVDELPSLLERARDALGALPLGPRLLDIARTVMSGGGSGEGLSGDVLSGGGALIARVLDVFRDTVGTLVSVLVVFAVSLYVSIDPDLYRRGLRRVLPGGWHERLDESFERLGSVLFWWFAGQAVSMTILGSTIAVGLWLLDVPFALLLGAFTAVMTFIPQVGPLIAAVPTLLAAAAQGVPTLAAVTVLVVLVQNLEGLVLTPFLHQRISALPPLLVLAALLVLGSTAGVVGVLVAMPLVAVGLALVNIWLPAARRDAASGSEG